MQPNELTHPLHRVNVARAMFKAMLRNYRPPVPKVYRPPVLDNSLKYYFIFETQPREDLDKMLYALCVFDSYGVIAFSRHGEMPVSLWRYRRQGLARTATMLQGVIVTSCKREGIPLRKPDPFFKVGDGLYELDINWGSYNVLRNHR